MSNRKWYIQIDRSNLDLSFKEPIVIGPFDDEASADEHLQNSLDVEDWVTLEAKTSSYIVEDAFLTQDPKIPSYGVNAPAWLED